MFLINYQFSSCIRNQSELSVLQKAVLSLYSYGSMDRTEDARHTKRNYVTLHFSCNSASVQMQRCAPLVLQQLEFMFVCLFVCLSACLMFAVTTEVTLRIYTSCLVYHCCKIYFSCESFPLLFVVLVTWNGKLQRQLDQQVSALLLLLLLLVVRGAFTF